MLKNEIHRVRRIKCVNILVPFGLFLKQHHLIRYKSMLMFFSCNTNIDVYGPTFGSPVIFLEQHRTYLFSRRLYKKNMFTKFTILY